jgi:hypothetical protein
MFHGALKEFWADLGAVMPGLLPGELAVLLALAILSSANNGETCAVLSIQEIRRTTGLSHVTISKAIRTLKRRELVGVEGRGHLGLPNIYRLKWPRLAKEPLKNLSVAAKSDVSATTREEKLRQREFEKWRRNLDPIKVRELFALGLRDQGSWETHFDSKIWEPFRQRVSASEMDQLLTENGA